MTAVAAQPTRDDSGCRATYAGSHEKCFASAIARALRELCFVEFFFDKKIEKETIDLSAFGKFFR